MDTVIADKSRIDGGLVYTWSLKAGHEAGSVWAGPTPLRMLLVTGIFGGARVNVWTTVTPDGGGPPVPAVTSEGFAVAITRARGLLLSPFGLWLRPELVGGDETTDVVVTLALVNPAHQRPMD